ncbi:MAG TPA: hypothetical protein V6C81_26945 [Planktothrix sp.]|jgi:hypothetical protein
MQTQSSPNIQNMSQAEAFHLKMLASDRPTGLHLPSVVAIITMVLGVIALTENTSLEFACGTIWALFAVSALALLGNLWHVTLLIDPKLRYKRLSVCADILHTTAFMGGTAALGYFAVLMYFPTWMPSILRF